MKINDRFLLLTIGIKTKVKKNVTQVAQTMTLFNLFACLHVMHV